MASSLIRHHVNDLMRARLDDHDAIGSHKITIIAILRHNLYDLGRDRHQVKMRGNSDADVESKIHSCYRLYLLPTENRGEAGLLLTAQGGRLRATARFGVGWPGRLCAIPVGSRTIVPRGCGTIRLQILAGSLP